MWIRIPHLLDAKPNTTNEEKESDEKVITSTRKVFDDAGLKTTSGFKTGNAVTLNLAFPADVETAINTGNITIDGTRHAAPCGTSNIDSSAANNILGWFTAFERDGRAFMVESRIDPTSPTTNHLHEGLGGHFRSTDQPRPFQNELADYNLRPPQLLYCLNITAAGKPTPPPSLLKAPKWSPALSPPDRGQRARRRDGPRLLRPPARKSTTSSLARIDSEIMMTCRAITRPADDEEKMEAPEELAQLTQSLTRCQHRIHRQCGTTILPPPPTIAAPPLPPHAPSTTPSSSPGIPRLSRNSPYGSPKSAKRIRTDSGSSDASTVEVLNTLNVDQDVQMVGDLITKRFSLPYPFFNAPTQRSAARQTRLMCINRPPSLNEHMWRWQRRKWGKMSFSCPLQRYTQDQPLSTFFALYTGLRIASARTIPRTPDVSQAAWPLQTECRHLLRDSEHESVARWWRKRSAPSIGAHSLRLLVPKLPMNALSFLAVSFLFASPVQTAVAATSFSMYALNGNGLVNSAKLAHINTTINARSPHSFVLSENRSLDTHLRESSKRVPISVCLS
ncbi:hypothetical protein DFH09DRAFT_1463229 [Mycena vulgaris]|nr:hypothetical protein DFH09DRAFT_1463229 [Mycena vulgaris]